MSPTMLLGRVVLPAAGLILAAALTWQSVRDLIGRGTPAARRRTRGQSPRAVRGRIIAEGRVVAYPGAQVTVGTEVLGTIINMPAARKAAVHKGDLLVELRSDEVQGLAPRGPPSPDRGRGRPPPRAGRARGSTGSSPSSRARSHSSRKRAESCSPAALARRDAAKAAVDRLDAEAARYRIVAPIDGVVIARHAEPGETVSPAAPLVTIVDLSRLRVEAEVDEFDIASVVSDATCNDHGRGISRSPLARRGRRDRRRRRRSPDPPPGSRPAGRYAASCSSRVAFREPSPLKLRTARRGRNRRSRARSETSRGE